MGTDRILSSAGGSFYKKLKNFETCKFLFWVSLVRFDVLLRLASLNFVSCYISGLDLLGRSDGLYFEKNSLKTRKL